MGIPWWFAPFDGLHLLLGFATNARSGTYCSTWIDNMVSDGPGDCPLRVAYSWFDMCDKTQPDGRTVRVVGESSNMKWDYLWGEGLGPQSDPVVDNSYWEWSHTKGEEIKLPPKRLSNGSLTETSMLLYEVVPKVIDEAYVNDLGAQFGILEDVANYGNGLYHMAWEAEYLQVSETEGISWGNVSQLWIPFEDPPYLPELEDAVMYAESFLDGIGLVPSDALAPVAIYSDSQVVAEKGTGRLVEGFPTYIQVKWDRELAGTYPVVGPGSTCMVYVGDGGDVCGLIKTWRDIEEVGSVEILSDAEMLELFNTYGSRVVLGGLPHYEELDITDISLGYYERGFGKEQSYLIPAYLLFADFMVDGSVQSSNVIFVPASRMFIPPIVEIISPPDSSSFLLGQPITFTGIASHAELSRDGDSDSEEDTRGRSCIWSSDLDEEIGSGPSITVSDLSYGNHTITLTVTGFNDATGADMIAVQVTFGTCGDADGSGVVDIDDVVYLIEYIFSDGPAPDPIEAGDADASGEIDIDDVVYLVNYIFAGGPEPQCP
jgi:hypothetical protein